MSRLRAVPAWLVLGLGVGLAGAVCADDTDPAALLERMAGALPALEYEGTVAYVHDGRVDSVQVTRTLGPGGPSERFVTLSGDRREVVNEGGALRCLTPGGTVSAPDQGGGLLQDTAAHLIQMRRHYRFSIAGADRVAGFDATVIDAAPLDARRYSYRLWLDRASGMLLGSMLREASGAPVEQLAFTQLRLRMASAAPAPPAARTATAAPPGSAWEVTDLPAGFALVARPSAATGSEHLLFSDGLASVSVYVDPPGKGLVGVSRRGAINAFGLSTADAHVVVVGDLPAATVVQIARSVRRAR